MTADPPAPEAATCRTSSSAPCSSGSSGSSSGACRAPTRGGGSGLPSIASNPIRRGQATTPPRGDGQVSLLTLSSLYPNPRQPNHGVFVENRLRHLVAGGEARSTVIAPVPWFPGRSGPAAPGDVPAVEERHGLVVHHPRFLAVPGLGMATNPFAYERAVARVVRRLVAAGQRFDLIDAHYLFPDGVAAVRLGRRFGLPVVLTARGSDTSLFPRYWLPGLMIRRALAAADGLIAVSAALKEGLVALGVPPERVVVLRNGVDLALFRPPENRDLLRERLGLTGPTLLSVGLLIPRKRHDLTIGAVAELPGVRLLIAGEGAERGALEALARRLGVADRVRFLGAVPHGELPALYGAADVMVLASEREGWANVLLEAMACGTPVVATPAWGSREAVGSEGAGIVVEEASAQAIAAAVRRLLAAPPSRAAVRAHAERFGWDEVSAGQLALFRDILGCRRAAASAQEREAWARA